MSARMRLRRSDGRIYLDRWGIEWKSVGGIFVHRMEGPDPGVDLHDHPWWFASVVLKGGYLEERCDRKDASKLAQLAMSPYPPSRPYGYNRAPTIDRRLFSIKTMQLSECHRIIKLRKTSPTWTLVIHGPNRRTWGFFTPSRYLPWREYEQSPSGRSRDLHVDISSNDPAGSRS